MRSTTACATCGRAARGRDRRRRRLRGRARQRRPPRRASASRRRRPVQALYLMLAPPGAGLRQRMAEFAWAVRNEVRPLGWQRLGGPCQLMGTGMAFPWATCRLHRSHRQASSRTCSSGSTSPCGRVAAVVLRAARVTACFPAQASASVAQRTRWEHGHLAMIASRGLPMLWSGIVSRKMALVGMALDLCVPPLAALVLSLLGLFLASAVLAAIGSSARRSCSHSSSSSWWRQRSVPRGRRSDAAACRSRSWPAPVYALAKIPILIRLFTARQLRWVRTGRDNGEG